MSTPRSPRGRRTAAAACVLAIASSSPLAVAPASADAEPPPNTITEYATTAEILPDGSVAISEAITYHFGDLSSPGISREIPLTINSDSNFWRERRIELNDLEVTSPTGADTRLDDASEQGGEFVILVGDEDDPSTDVTGEHTYVISYTVEGALTEEDGYDAFEWNFVGTEWQAQIENTSVEVTAPEIAAVECFAGEEDSTDPCDSADHDATTATFAHDRLLSERGVTATVELPSDAVQVAEPEYGLRLPSPLALTALAIALAAIAAAVIAEYIGRRRARDYGDHLPDGLTPGLAALVLSRGEMSSKVLLTMLTDLERRGAITSRPHETTPREWWFELSDSPPWLSPADRALLDSLFHNRSPTTLSEWSKTLTPEDGTAVRKRLLEEGRRLGLLTPHRFAVSLGIGLVGLCVVSTFFYLWNNGYDGAGLAGLAMAGAFGAALWGLRFDSLPRYGKHVREQLREIGRETSSGGPRSVAEYPAWAVAVDAPKAAARLLTKGASGGADSAEDTPGTTFYADGRFRHRWHLLVRRKTTPKKSSGSGVRNSHVTGGGFSGGGGGGGGVGGGGGGGGGGSR